MLNISAAPKLVDSFRAVLSVLDVPFSIWTNHDTGESRFDIFIESPDEANQLENVLKDQLEHWQSDNWSIEHSVIKNENWQESWKAYFHVDHVSDRIVVKPSWESYDAHPNDCVIEIDPGMSFGTGQHATTRGCLRFLDSISDKGTAGSFLDLGCGSGILSIAAAKLGYAPITAVDIDPDAVRIANENLTSNEVRQMVTTDTADVSIWKPNHPYSVVAANILAPILLANSEHIASTVKSPNGYLILAGILTTQYQDILDEYSQYGFTEVDRFTEAEWTSGCFILDHKANKAHQ